MEFAELGGWVLAQRLGAARYPALRRLRPQGPSAPSPSPPLGPCQLPVCTGGGRFLTAQISRGLRGAGRSQPCSAAPDQIQTLAVGLQLQFAEGGRELEVVFILA